MKLAHLLFSQLLVTELLIQENFCHVSYSFTPDVFPCHSTDVQLSNRYKKHNRITYFPDIKYIRQPLYSASQKTKLLKIPEIWEASDMITDGLQFQ